jgi:hypothetical protein
MPSIEELSAEEVYRHLLPLCEAANGKAGREGRPAELYDLLAVGIVCRLDFLEGASPADCFVALPPGYQKAVQMFRDFRVA